MAETPEFVQISLYRFIEFTKQKEEADAAVEVANLTASMYSKAIIDLLKNISIPADSIGIHSNFVPAMFERYNANANGKFLFRITNNNLSIYEKAKQ